MFMVKLAISGHIGSNRFIAKLLTYIGALEMDLYKSFFTFAGSIKDEGALEKNIRKPQI